MSKWNTLSQIHDGPIHLGEKRIAKWPKAQGRVWQTPFFLDRVPSGDVHFVGHIFQTDGDHNEVIVNHTRIGHLPRHRGSKYKRIQLAVPKSTFCGGENYLRIKASELGEHGVELDNFLIARMSIGRRAEAPSGPKSRFFRSLKAVLAADGWNVVRIAGFKFACTKNRYPYDALIGFFDADDNSAILEGAHAKLDRWADKNGWPSYRLAVAVYDSARKPDIQYVTTKLQAGSRMSKQSMTGVIHLRGLAYYQPKETGSPWISVDASLSREIQEAINDAMAPR